MRTWTRGRDESGQALVEFALVLPILIILLLGMLEFGRAWNAKQAITDAAREGARRAVVQDGTITQDSVDAAVARALSRSGIPGSAVTIQFDRTPAPGNWRRTGEMQTVYVGVDYRFGFFGPLVKALTGSETIRIASLVTMRNE